MHIVQIYHSPVPVKLYGGMERVIEALCAGFIEAGHKVTLISYSGDYLLPGVDFRPLDKFKTPHEALNRYHELIPDSADVLHFHVPMEWDWEKLPLPYVVTMHGNLQENEKHKVLPPNTIFLCRDHAHRHGRSAFVFNGLNPQEIPLSLTPLQERRQYAFLGRASLKRKGIHLAKKLAKDLGAPLKIGGGRGISFGNHQYLGHLNNAQKFKLLEDSKALLFPILWEEPFGLVLIEAMFTGTSVFALSKGSVPEVLGQPGSEGLFLHKPTAEELLYFAKKFQFAMTPQTIRDYALNFFTHQKMALGYLEYYRQVMDGKKLT